LRELSAIFRHHIAPLDDYRCNACMRVFAVHEFVQNEFSRTTGIRSSAGNTVVKLEKFICNPLRFLTESCQTCKAWKMFPGFIFLYRKVGSLRRRICDACRTRPHDRSVDDKNWKISTHTYDKEFKISFDTSPFQDLGEELLSNMNRWADGRVSGRVRQCYRIQNTPITGFSFAR